VKSDRVVLVVVWVGSALWAQPGPVVTYSTLFGSSQGDSVASMSVDQVGNTYVVGSAQSNFPVTTGATPSSIFIGKFGPNGSLVYSTFFGGSGPVSASSTALDAAGNLYVAGTTSSSNFPTTVGAFKRAISCGTIGTLGSDGFLAKFSPNGALVYSTLLGQCSLPFDGGAYVGSIAAVSDATGDVFAAVNLLAPKSLGKSAALVKVNPSGSIVSQISGLDQSYNVPFHTSALAIDSGGFLYLTGTVGNFPLAPVYAFVLKVSSTGSAVYTAMLGTCPMDTACATGTPSGIAVDSLGQAYVTGSTQGGIPPTPGSYRNGTTGSFITKLASTGNTVLYTAVIAGGQSNAIAVDSSGRCYVVGSASPSLPVVVSNATQPKYGGGASDAFLFELSQDGSTPLFATFLGGSQSDSASSMAMGADGSIYVTGNTDSPDFPRTSAVGGGGGDVFVTKFAPGTSQGVPVINVTSDASFATQISPGSLVSLFGNGNVLAATTVSEFNAPLPTSANGTSVAINGVLCPLVYVSPSQINLQAPMELQPGTATVVVNNNGQTFSTTVQVLIAAPGIFTTDYYANGGVAILQDSATGTILNVNHPAVPGENVTTYFTGIGPVTNNPGTGNAAPLSPLSQATSAVSVAVNGISVQPSFTGLTPGFAGLGQVNFQLPSSSPSGNSVPLVLTINGVSSKTVQISVD